MSPSFLKSFNYFPKYLRATWFAQSSPWPFFLFLKLTELVPTSGCCSLCLNSLCSRAFQALLLLFVQITDQASSCQRSLPGHAMKQCTLPLCLGTPYHIILPFFCLFQPTAFITIWISLLCVFLYGSSTKHEFHESKDVSMLLMTATVYQTFTMPQFPCIPKLFSAPFMPQPLRQQRHLGPSSFLWDQYAHKYLNHCDDYILVFTCSH